MLFVNLPDLIIPHYKYIYIKNIILCPINICNCYFQKTYQENYHLLFMTLGKTKTKRTQEPLPHNSITSEEKKLMGQCHCVVHMGGR